MPLKICITIIAIVLCVVSVANTVEYAMNNEILNQGIPSWGNEKRVKIINNNICEDGSISILLLVDSKSYNINTMNDALLYSWSIISKVFKNTDAQLICIEFAIPLMETYNRDSGNLHISREKYNEINTTLAVEIQKYNDIFKWRQ